MSESRKNINEIVAALVRLRNNNGNLKADDKALFDESRLVFEKLKRLSDFDPDDIGKVVEVLDKLPPEIKELDIGEIDIEAKEMEVKSLNKEDLKELIEDYESAQKGDRKEEIGEEIVKRTGKRNVDQFIGTQKEIAARNREKLEKLSSELREKVTQDLARISDEDHEEIANILEKATLEEKFNKKELEKEIKKVFKEKEEAAKIIKKVEEIRAEIKVESKAEEIAKRTYEKLVSENIPVTNKLENELREKILIAVRDGSSLDLPKQIEGRSQDISVIEVGKEVEKFKQDNLTDVVNYRAGELKDKIEIDLRNSGVRDQALIEEYAYIVAEYTYNPEITRAEINNRQIEDEVNSYLTKNNIEPKLNPVFATEEAKFMANNLPMAPQKFNRLVKQYNVVREKLEKVGIGVDKLPKMKEVRVVEKLMNQFNKYPQVLKMMNGAQRMVRFLDAANNFPASLLAKIGVPRAGLQVLGRIGGQAAVELVKNAAIVLAEQGTAQGIRSIATALFTHGAVIAGEAGSATAGALTGLVAAFQTLPVVGQVIAVVVIVVAAVITIIKPIIDGIKNLIRKLGINPDGVKNFLSDTLGLGNFVGGVGQFGADVMTFFVGIPALLGLISFTAIITPVVIFFFLGIFTYTLFQHNLVSSIVPPTDMGNCVLKNETGGNINCDPNAPENSWPAVDKTNFIRVANEWKPGTPNFAETCYNDVVNRALCAGINPTFALWTWLHESGASNYFRDDIEDFGIHFIPENKNFNAQITAFLKLDPGSACISDPRVGGDYWLAFSANFLNGNCDPDLSNPITGTTPRQYATELKETWTWISNAPIPNSIHVAKGGKNCGSIGGEAPLPGNAKEVTDSEGNVWICTENTQSSGSDYDPNAPGLTGVIVDGECSVGDVVVPTKQCDPQWGSTQLSGENCSNGGPGTICSAGCGPTSVSMMMRHINGSYTPKTVIFSPGSAYANMGCNGSSLGQAQTELVKKFGDGTVTYDGVTRGCDEKAIANWICQGKVVMVLANFYRNSSLGLGGHFVLAIGVRGGKIVVADPYYGITDTPFDGTRAYGYAHDIRECLTVEKSAIK